jgi:zinc D-Ala-D-Ala carboxypeptidase
MQLTKNFNLSEFTKSQTAVRKGIPNIPSPDHIENITALAKNVLQPIRDEFGPVIINSGYRSQELNAAIGGSATSQHCKGEAADIECVKVDNANLAEWIKLNLDFDQLILEGYTGEPRSGWIHVSHKKNGPQRHVVLTAVFDSTGRVSYKQGLWYD